ncbi:LTA synthase family protein [Bacillus mesophilum]|uniref:LTA synthase family protein n=1 Tax=Bacillus mesophilum TaxID=1071718 RepID=A0A7V7RN32_9BACI|nr:LTA synthase family protein [Bacillus mesophilum]KAB2333856.1 LTA synthase family protein [Bacillus mesophilum]
MSKIKMPAISIISIAVFLLWIKTYIVYKTSFDIQIDNWKQELILFINPLSFLLIVLGIGLFFKERTRNIYVLASSFLISVVLFANVVFYRFYNDYITLPVLFQTSNMSDLGSSVNELLRFSDLLYFTDVVLIVLIILLKPKFALYKKYTKIKRAAFFIAAAALAFFNIGLAESQWSDLLTRTFDREVLVKNIGTYNYHVYDLFLQTKSSAQRAMADGSELADIDNYIHAGYDLPNEHLFGAAKNKNVYLIAMESVQSFVVNQKVKDQEITPFLNDFIKESYYFDQFYHQTAQGKSSDSEFLIDTSLYPLDRGAVFFTHSGNQYEAMPEILRDHGYTTAAFHANNKSFWNRDIMYSALGYDRFYSLPSYEVNQDNSVGWGLKDIEFFEQSIEHIKEIPSPFLAKFITLTNHFPFELKESDQLIESYASGDSIVDNYFQTVRYTDEAVKTFVQKLKDEGLYEDSIIVLYGDHYGLSEHHNSTLSGFLGKEVTPLVNMELQRVPLVIHIPGQEGKTISSVAGQIDVKPTLLHLLGINTKNGFNFGSDLFSETRSQFTVLRDGSFISEKYVYTRNTCYDQTTGEQVGEIECSPFIEEAKRELEYSDSIINGDLLRFYPNKQK